MECWRAVVGFEGLYEISDEGRVRSLRPANQSQRTLNEDHLALIWRLHGEGVSARRIAPQIGVCQPVVSKILRGAAYKNTSRILRPAMRSDGYRFVTLAIKGAHWHKTIHGMVAAAFIGPRPPGHHVNHIDGDKTNNHHDNLEYVTASENARHSLTVLKKRRKITPQQVQDIRQAKVDGQKRAEVAARHGISIHMVTAIWRGISYAYEP